jgi:PKD repeat protein/lysophospholipase L1-like esterase
MLCCNHLRRIFIHSIVLAFLVGIFVSLPAPSIAAVESCPAEIAAYWNLNETSGNSFDDLVDGNVATCDTCPTPAEGNISGGQRFKRSSSTGVDAGGSVFNWPQNSSFSIELWMKKNGACTNDSPSANEVLVGRDHPTSDSKLHWWLGIECDAKYPSGVAAFKLRDNNGKFFSLIGKTNLTDGNWHHLVAVNDGVGHKIYLYVDGVLEGTKTATYTGDFSAGSAALNIGWLNADGVPYRFSGVLDEIAIYNNVLPVKTIRSHYALARGYCLQCEDTVKILPLGDSITVGNDAGRDNPADPADTKSWISYRRDLWWGLEEDGFSVDFVGNRVSGSAVTPPFDGDHEGHGGYTTANILDGKNGDPGLADWLATLSSAGALPDVVLLHIGTNDIGGMTDVSDIPAAINNLGEILNVIHAANEDATVVLAKIIKRSCVVSSSGYAECQNKNTLTGYFNEAIDDLLTDRKTQGKGDKVIVVDMESGAGIDYRRQSGGGDMWDELHPYETGFVKMAAAWRRTLAAFLPVCLTSAPNITSADSVQVAVNQELNYTAKAGGKPAPEFSLNTAIGGMTIDSTSGAILWTPTKTGHYTATVIATNSEGQDEKTVDIYVTEAPICPSDITSHWKLDEAQDPTYEDSVGDLDGSCSGNCPKAAAGKVGGAQYFDGSYTGVNVPADPSFDWASDGSFTIEYWMYKPLGANCEGNEVVAGRDNAAKANDAGLHWWTGCYDDGKAAFQLRNNAGTGRLLRGTTFLLDGKWHHVAAVRDGANNKNLLYVDGALENSVSFTYSEGFDHASAPLNIGHLNSYFRYKGRIDEVALYGRALDAGEIQEQFTRGALGYCDLTPTIYQHPEEQRVIKGETATFTVVAGGGAKLRYQWQRKAYGATVWVNITGARSATYTTPPTTGALHKSSYRCRVTNEYGLQKPSRAAILRVNVLPVITRQPASQTVLKGRSATFTVKATGSAPLKYQWKKDGVIIPGATSASYTTPALAAADHNSRFVCVVKNAFGSTVKSDIATLKVNVPPVITTQPVSRTVAVGKSAKFTVKATGSAPLKYQWRKNGVDIAGATSAAYTTPGTTMADNGDKFRCVVTNAFGRKVWSDTATLTVK